VNGPASCGHISPTCVRYINGAVQPNNLTALLPMQTRSASSDTAQPASNIAEDEGSDITHNTPPATSKEIHLTVAIAGLLRRLGLARGPKPTEPEPLDEVEPALSPDISGRDRDQDGLSKGPKDSLDGTNSTSVSQNGKSAQHGGHDLTTTAKGPETDTDSASGTEKILSIVSPPECDAACQDLAAAIAQGPETEIASTYAENKVDEKTYAQCDEDGSRPEPVLTDLVAFSAQICAAARALEREHAPSSRLVDDPLAEALAGPAAMKRIRDNRNNSSDPRSSSPRIPIRTRYFDEFLESAIQDEALKPSQVVILGAGMDTRVFRIDALSCRPNITVYEMDQQSVISCKLDLLARIRPSPKPNCKVVRVFANLSEIGWDSSLVLAGFSWESPAVWIIEGLVYYFEEEQVETLFRTVNSLASPGSRICVSCVSEIGSRPQTSPAQVLSISASESAAPSNDVTTMQLSSKFKWACSRPETYFPSVGFRICEIVWLGGDKANYGRWPQDSEPSRKTMYITLTPAVKISPAP
jgi:methyltransferase (TIGR00027 family)